MVCSMYAAAGSDKATLTQPTAGFTCPAPFSAQQIPALLAFPEDAQKPCPAHPVSNPGRGRGLLCNLPSPEGGDAHTHETTGSSTSLCAKCGLGQATTGIAASYWPGCQAEVQCQLLPRCPTQPASSSPGLFQLGWGQVTQECGWPSQALGAEEQGQAQALPGKVVVHGGLLLGKGPTKACSACTPLNGEYWGFF